ncbi:unnamed protein product [Cochlearia groenlandica]
MARGGRVQAPPTYTIEIAHPMPPVLRTQTTLTPPHQTQTPTATPPGSTGERHSSQAGSSTSNAAIPPSLEALLNAPSRRSQYVLHPHKEDGALWLWLGLVRFGLGLCCCCYVAIYMQKAGGVEPAFIELVRKTHTRRDGTSVDRRVEAIVNEVEVVASSQVSEDNETSPSPELINKAYLKTSPNLAAQSVNREQVNREKGDAEEKEDDGEGVHVPAGEVYG